MENGLASFGQAYSLISAIIATVVAVIFFFLGYTVYYMPDKKPIDPSKLKNKTVGIIMMLVATVVACASWGMYYMAKESKGFAAVEGAVGGYEIAKDIF